MTDQGSTQEKSLPALFSRIAKKQDLAALFSLINGAFKDGNNPHLIKDRCDEEEVAQRLETGHFLLIEEEGEITGSIYTEIREQGKGYLGLLVVDSKRRRSGIGERLLRAGEEFCKERGCNVLELDVVNLRPDLRRYYERFGYRVVGEIPGVLRDRVDRDYSLVLMEKDLQL